MIFSNEGYDGTKFYDFYAARDASAGPGWFIFGRDKNKYGIFADGRGRYVKLCGFVTRRKACGFNGPVRCGWKTKREAEKQITQILREA